MKKEEPSRRRLHASTDLIQIDVGVSFFSSRQRVRESKKRVFIPIEASGGWRRNCGAFRRVSRLAAFAFSVSVCIDETSRVVVNSTLEAW